MVMGSNTVDVYVSTDVDLIEISHAQEDTDSLLGYPLGEKLLADDVHLAVGGSGVNAATAFARVGFQTTYTGCLGNDMFGARVLDHLDSEEISFNGVLGDQNGLGIILESQATDRTIISYKGCNSELELSDVTVEAEPDWFYSSTVIGETQTTMKSLIQSFEQTKTAVNISSYLAENGVDSLEPILSFTDYLFVNREEARSMTGDHDITTVLKNLNSAVRGQAVVTAGSDGVYYEAERVRRMLSHSEDVVDTTGAGDAFNAGFITARSSDMSFADSVQAGMVQSEQVIQSENTTDNLLHKDDLLSALQDDDRESEVIR